MKITTFNPLIITHHPESVIALFEELGFERRHTKSEIGEIKTTNVRMKNAEGFYVDVAQAPESRTDPRDLTVIRMNVDDFDEAIEFLTAHGFRKPSIERAAKTVDTGSSQYTFMVSPSGFVLNISEHFKNHA